MTRAKQDKAKQADGSRAMGMIDDRTREPKQIYWDAFVTEVAGKSSDNIFIHFASRSLRDAFSRDSYWRIKVKISQHVVVFEVQHFSTNQFLLLHRPLRLAKDVGAASQKGVTCSAQPRFMWPCRDPAAPSAQVVRSTLGRLAT